MSNNHLNNRQTRALAQITVREATPADDASLERLAQLDSARPLTAPVLLAEVAGEVRAAVSMLDGRTVADPFTASAKLTAMLRMRAGLVPTASDTPIRNLGRSLWKRGTGRDPRPAQPSSPSVPGLPSVPSRAA
jgi:hypothetical protein